MLDGWCAKVGRDGSKIARTINVGFYMGADTKGAARARALPAGKLGRGHARIHGVLPVPSQRVP